MSKDMASRGSQDRSVVDVGPLPHAIPDAAREALEAVLHWASRKCPCGPPDYGVDEPKICPLCRADVDDPKTWCMAVESTIPRHLLTMMRRALADGVGRDPRPTQAASQVPGTPPNPNQPEGREP